MRGLLYPLFFLAMLPAYAQNRIFPYSDGKKWGLTNENREVVIAPQYDTAFWFDKGPFAIVQKNELYGTIALDGKPLLPCKYKNAWRIINNIGIAELAGKCRLVDLSTGKQISPVLFDQLQQKMYSDPCILEVRIGDKLHFINTITGKLINQKGYDEAGFTKGDYYQGWVKQGEYYGVINLKTGAMIVPVKYDHIVYKPNGAFDAISGDQVTYYSADGKSKPGDNSQTMATTSAGGNYERAISSEDSYFSPGLSLYIYKTGDKSWKAAYENRSRKDVPGDPLLPYVYELKGYDTVEMFTYGDAGSHPPALLKVTKYGKFGLITVNGDKVLECTYDGIEREDDFYRIIQDGKEGVISTGLKQIRPPVLQHVIYRSADLQAYFIEVPDGKKGFMDEVSGKIFIPGVTL